MRPQPLLQLLQSVKEQTIYPNEILIIDGSTNDETSIMLQENAFNNLQYYIVSAANRGLTKQRNFGISKVKSNSEIVFFLDDDIVLEPLYIQNILQTYKDKTDAAGVGGFIINENSWNFVGQNYKPKLNEFFYDGYKIRNGSRFIARKIFKLDSNEPPGYLSDFSHGRSLSFLPPSGKTYSVEQLMGGVSSFKKEILERYKFSEYFEGYGLYEDADFTIRVSKQHQLYLNTSAKLSHFHAPEGRPNQYKYGKMVVRNGYYVWKVRNPNPKLINIIKWNAITILLIIIRFSNIFTTDLQRFKTAFTEATGRTAGYYSLLFNKPK